MKAVIRRWRVVGLLVVGMVFAGCPNPVKSSHKGGSGGDVSAPTYSVTYGKGIFVAVAVSDDVGAATSQAATSTDGVSWTSRALPTLSNWTSVTFGNGTFVGVFIVVDQGDTSSIYANKFGRHGA